MQEKFNLQLPQYKGSLQCLRLSASQTSADPCAMRQNYTKGGLLEESMDKDPLKEFDK